MAVTKITWENKTGIQNDTSVARKNKVTDEDMNEIKQAVNNNADELGTAKDNIEDLQSGQGTANTDITSLKNRVTTLETDNTQNKSDINTLKSDNQTNKSNISTMQGQISDIQQEQQTQNTNIEGLQENDIEQDELISKLQEDNQKLKNALLNAETEEAKSLHVEDANRFGSLEVLGNHEQETRSGKNKLNLANIEQTTKNGIAATYNKEDGSVTFNGTCTADNTVFAVSDNQFDAVQNQTTLSAFYASGSASSSSENDIVVRAYNTDWSSVTNLYLNNLSSSNSNLKIVIPGSGSRSVGFRFDEGVVLNNFTIKCMVTSTEAEATGYEQYGASPSPDYPSPVVCLGSNKNKFNKDTVSLEKFINASNGVLGNLDTTSASDFIEVNPSSFIILSGETNNYPNGGAFYDNNKNYISGILTENIKNAYKVPEGAKYIRITTTTSLNNNIKLEELEEGDTATSYSPYRTR